MSKNQDPYATWERRVGKILTPFEEFIHGETTSGILLMIATLLALIVANSVFAAAYEHLLHVHLKIILGDFILDYDLHHWINDGLMVLFFFLVGLEIKREVLVGELSEPRQAALPIIAAVGGMVVPALCYTVLNLGTPAIDGWGIPMATDIAFAVGVLVLLGNRIPKQLFTFLVALAIVDDLGAVLVIAIFYTDQLVYEALGAAGVMIGLLIVCNIGGVRQPWAYFILGVLLWLCMLKSGVHATLAGIITAWCIPARSKLVPQEFSGHVRDLMDRYDTHDTEDPNLMRAIHKRAIVQSLENSVHAVETPLQRLEHSLHLPVSVLIIPIFALANAGVPLAWSEMHTVLLEPVTLGVVIGLVFGKFIGIGLFSWLAIRSGLASMPEGVTWKHLAGAAMLGGIGFTMSIFIAELAFPGQTEVLILAKTGILMASLFTGLLGYFWLLAVCTPGGAMNHGKGADSPMTG